MAEKGGGADEFQYFMPLLRTNFSQFLLEEFYKQQPPTTCTLTHTHTVFSKTNAQKKKTVTRLTLGRDSSTVALCSVTKSNEFNDNKQGKKEKNI